MKAKLDYRDVLDGYKYDLANDQFIKIWLAGGQPAVRDDSLITEEIPKEEVKKLFEGATKQIIVNAYERNPEARQICIDYYRQEFDGVIKCWVCGFNFGEFYGELMEGRIHIHHKIPLKDITKEYQVIPEEDLIPICPNCHYVIHFLGCTAEDLKEMLELKKKQ